MENEKRLNLIKVLLKSIIIREKEEQKFIETLNDINILYEINLSEKLDGPFYEIGNILGINDENEIEKLYQDILDSNDEINNIVNFICEKYQI